MNSLAAMLLNIIFTMDQNTSTEYLASFFLTHYLQIPTMSQQDVLEKAHLSSATLKKFCMHLGFDSYKDLKNYASISITMRNDQYKNRYESITTSQMLKNLKGIAGQDFDQEAFMKTIEKAADLIHAAKEIVWIGALFPLALSLDFAEDLVLTGKAVVYNQLNNDLQIKPFSQQDIIILPTLTGLFVPENVPGFIEKIQDVPVILISQKNLSMPEILNCHLIKLPDMDQSNQANLLLLETYNFIKYMYYSKYVYQV